MWSPKASGALSEMPAPVADTLGAPVAGGFGEPGQHRRDRGSIHQHGIVDHHELVTDQGQRVVKTASQCGVKGGAVDERGDSLIKRGGLHNCSPLERGPTQSPRSVLPVTLVTTARHASGGQPLALTASTGLSTLKLAWWGQSGKDA